MHLARLFRSVVFRAPRDMQVHVYRYEEIFAAHYVNKALPPHPDASTMLLSSLVSMNQLDISGKFWN